MLKEPQKYAVCGHCEEIIEYDPVAAANTPAIAHDKCGKRVLRDDPRGREYQYLLEIGMGPRIAWESVFRIPSLKPRTRLAIMREKDKAARAKARIPKESKVMERSDVPLPEEPPAPAAQGDLI